MKVCGCGCHGIMHVLQTQNKLELIVMMLYLELEPQVVQLILKMCGTSIADGIDACNSVGVCTVWTGAAGTNRACVLIRILCS